MRRGPRIFSDGLVLLYDFADFNCYPRTGTALRDLSGNSNSGSIENSPAFTRQVQGEFSMVGGANHQITTSTQFSNPTTFSLCTWFKTSGTQRKIIGFESNRTGTTSVDHDRHVYLASNGYFHFGVWTGTKTSISTSFSLADNNWKYAVATWDNNTMKIYVNGQLSAQGTGIISAASYSGYWRIGGYKNDFWQGNGDGYWTGTLAMVSIYNRVLTQEQVTQNFEALRARFGI